MCVLQIFHLTFFRGVFFYFWWKNAGVEVSSSNNISEAARAQPKQPNSICLKFMLIVC